MQICLNAVAAALSASMASQAYVIGFDALSGANADVYSGSSEGGFNC